MSDKSREEVLDILQKDFSEEVAHEILDMIDRLGKEDLPNDKIEEEVTQHLLHHVEEDLNQAILERSGPVKAVQPNTVPPGRAKRR